MNVFVLEDDYNRITWMKENFPESVNATYSECVYESNDLLSKNQYDLIFLDHDLGGKVFQDSSEDTGYKVACFIPNSINKKTPVIIHSWNPKGAELMKNHLRRNFIECHYLPFGTKEFNDNVKGL